MIGDDDLDAGALVRRLIGTLAALLAVLLAGAALAGARPPDQNSRTSFDPAIMQSDESRYLGQPVDRATPLLDDAGGRFALAEVLGKPAILVLSYYGCDGSCPTVNQNLAAVLAQVTRFRPGADFRVLTVSFDRADTPGTAARFVEQMKALPAALRAGWRFAVLADPAADAPRAFADAVGFQYFWSRIDKTFMHPNVLVFLTPEGRVARYLYGTRLDARAVELALIDADWGRIAEGRGSVFDMITGACYSFNYSEGRYQPNYALLAGLGSLLFGLGLIGLGAFAYRRKLARRAAHVH